MRTIWSPLVLAMLVTGTLILAIQLRATTPDPVKDPLPAGVVVDDGVPF
jgi:hypothetical protein